MPSSSSSGSSIHTSKDGKFPTVAEMEQDLIKKALERTGGKRNEAANLLGINVRTLRNKLKEYGSEDLEEEETASKKD
jgi:DNA-binding NtrC family response regulator